MNLYSTYIQRFYSRSNVKCEHGLLSRYPKVRCDLTLTLTLTLTLSEGEMRERALGALQNLAQDPDNKTVMWSNLQLQEHPALIPNP